MQPVGAPLTHIHSQKHAGLKTPRSGGAIHNLHYGVESPMTKREEALFISNMCSPNHHFSFLNLFAEMSSLRI